ncbi:hypothetical protein LCGC14_1796230 [marine sediment metagenome]|uniref:Uncharacterized protein n=1 Tax=marine sediment metagenome TaxID=412755 RepID=A0A0F9J5W2_9ZZZZ
MNIALRDQAGTVLRGFLAVTNKSQESRAYMSGYLSACRHAGAIDLPDYEAAIAVVEDRQVPEALHGRMWWHITTQKIHKRLAGLR